MSTSTKDVVQSFEEFLDDLRATDTEDLVSRHDLVIYLSNSISYEWNVMIRIWGQLVG